MNDDLPKLELEARQRIIERTALGVRIGLEALSLRLILVLALVLNAGSIAWTLAQPDWQRLAASCLFALFSYFVIHVKPPKE